MQLESPPAAEFVATVTRSAFSAAGPGRSDKSRRRFDKSSATVRSYTSRLQEQQEQVLKQADAEHKAFLKRRE